MTLSDSIEKALNKQFNLELYSANFYLQMASYFIVNDLTGFGHFFIKQYEEELQHARKIFEYLHERQGNVQIAAIDAPTQHYNSFIEALEAALAHEKEVTKAIHELVELSLNEKDFATYTFLQWFVSEQVEEEALFSNLLAQLRRAATNPAALYMLDNTLHQRK